MPREEVPVMIQTLHGSYGSSSTEDRLRTRPVPTKLSRQQVVRSESSSSSSSPSTKSPNRISDKMDRRSPNNSERGSQKKRPIKLAEMEEELKKVKDELITSELSKKRIQQEAEEARKQLILLSEKLNETESQLAESSSLDDSRIFELRKLSQERDRAWQNELEAMQKQHSVDSVALATAMSEIFKLKGMVREREKERDVARKELEASRGTIDSILVDGSKLMDSFGAVVGELEESRVQIKMLEEKLSRIGKEEESREIHGDVETLEIKLHEEEILSMVQWQCVGEIIKQIQIESKERETKLEEAANSAKSEIMLLKANLFDKDCEFRKILDQSKKKEAEAELNLNLTKLKENLEKKEKKLNQVLHENELLRAELTKLSTEREKLCEQSIIEKKIAIEAQKEALSKLEIAIEEVKESKEKASIVNEKLDSVTNMKAEMETELRRLRIQADQWKKAAETAMTLLTVGSKDKLIERTNSYNSNSNLNLNLSNSVSGKFGSLDFPDELDDEPLSWKNGNVLRRISGMWKK